MQFQSLSIVHGFCSGRVRSVLLVAGMLLAVRSCAAGATDRRTTDASQVASLTSDLSLRALRQANIYGASLFHTQAPGPDFAQQMRGAIPRDYPGMDQGIRLGLANIRRDLPYLSGYFAHKNPQQVASFVATYRAKIMAPKDPVEQQMRLAEVMAFIALTSYRQHRNGTAATNAFEQQQMQALRYKQLQRAVRSYSPTCVPGSTDPSCHP